MGRIENYDNDSGISTFDRLFGTSYEGIVDGRPVYKTKNYLMGEIISKVTSEVASAGDRYSVISFKFSGQSLYDLGDAESGVLGLDPSSNGNKKHWVLVPGIENKAIALSNVVVYLKKGSIPYDVTYSTSFAAYNAGFTGYPGNIQYEMNTAIYNGLEVDYFKNGGALLSGYNIISGKPLMLSVENTTIMTEGDGEFGIWVEYKYIDFNLDFNG